MKKYMLLLLFTPLLWITGHAQERDPSKESTILAQWTLKSLNYYYSGNITMGELKELKVQTVQKAKALISQENKTQQDFIDLLDLGVLLSGLSWGEDDILKWADIINQIKTQSLSAVKIYRSGQLKGCLSFFLMNAFPILSQRGGFYELLMQSMRLSLEGYVESQNVQSAFALAMYYMGGIGVIPTVYSRPTVFMAKQFLSTTLESDNNSSYITYLTHIYSAHFYYKLHDFTKYQESIDKAKAFYPNGFFLTIMKQSFDAGNTLF